MAKFFTHTGEMITLAPQPFGTGGEGAVFQIQSSQSYRQGYCAKLYHKAVQREAKNAQVLNTLEQKIKYMVGNPPESVSSEIWILSWPVAVLYDSSKHFVGMIMPLAFDKSIKLSMLITNAKKPAKALKGFWRNWTDSDWERFDVSSPEGLLGRLKLIANICKPIHMTHSRGCYVFVDLKPENILVNGKGQVSICDMDSIQISEQGRVLFVASARTPDYSPMDKVQNGCFEVSWDRFSLSVIIYKLLFLIHPFTGTCHSPYDKCEDLISMIENALYPHGSNKKHFKVIHKFHNNLMHCPAVVQEFFLRAFDKEKGWGNPNMRPSAADWGQMIAGEVAKFVVPPPINQGKQEKTSAPSHKPKMDLEYFKRLQFWLNEEMQSYTFTGEEKGGLCISIKLKHNVKYSTPAIATLMLRIDDRLSIVTEVNRTITPGTNLSIDFPLSNLPTNTELESELYVLIRPKKHNGSSLPANTPPTSDYYAVLNELQEFQIATLRIQPKKSLWRRIFG